MAERTRLVSSDVVQWSPAAVATEVDGEVVLMSVERGRCYGLGETGSAVWRGLERPVRIGELCAGLAKEYSGDGAAIEGDVLALLEELRGEGLIEVKG
jgi:hypothetical protein